MEALPKISIVMPVYNVEQFIEEALISCMAQTLEDFELICVDDGSTDSSRAIAASYSEVDSRITLIDQPNYGAAIARNRGFEQARAPYVIFLDSDDFFEPTMLESMYARITADKADICMAGAFIYDNITGKERVFDGKLKRHLLPEATPFTSEEVADRIYQLSSPAPWTHLYRADFIRENKLFFQNLAYSNDTFFFLTSFACADKLTYVGEPLVHYRANRSGSAVTGLRYVNTRLTIEAFLLARSWLIDHELYERVCDSFITESIGNFRYNDRRVGSADEKRLFYEEARSFMEGFGRTPAEIRALPLMNEEDAKYFEYLLTCDFEQKLLNEFIDRCELLEKSSARVEELGDLYSESFFKAMRLEESLQQTQSSYSYRIGRRMTSPYRSMRDLMRANRSQMPRNR